MTITLYGMHLSPPFNTVRVILRELGIEYKEVKVAIYPITEARTTPKYKEMVPFGQVPWIDDNGLIVYESRAICRYLILRYGNDKTGKLLPSFNPSTDEEWKALVAFEQAVCVEQHQYNALILTIMSEKLFKSFIGQPTDVAVLENALGKLEAVLDVYELILSKQKYIAGNNLSLADLLHIPYGQQLDMVDQILIGNPKRPNVLRWWNEIGSRDSYAGLGLIAVAEELKKKAP